MKTFKSKLFTIFLAITLLLLPFFTTACNTQNNIPPNSNSIHLVVYHNDTTIDEYVQLNISANSINLSGYNIESVKLNCKQLLNLLITNYHTKLQEQHSQQLLTNDEYTLLYNGITFVGEDISNNEFKTGLQYSNSAVYKKFHELLNNIQFGSTPEQNKKLFYTKTYYRSLTNYGSNTVFTKVLNYCSNTIFRNTPQEDMSLTYSYSVSSKRYHSDADNISIDNNGNYLHTWSLNYNNPTQKICLYTITANRSAWLIVCIATTLAISTLLIIAAIIIAIINKNKLKNNNM